MPDHFLLQVTASTEVRGSWAWARVDTVPTPQPVADQLHFRTRGKFLAETPGKVAVCAVTAGGEGGLSLWPVPSSTPWTPSFMSFTTGLSGDHRKEAVGCRGSGTTSLPAFSSFRQNCASGMFSPWPQAALGSRQFAVFAERGAPPTAELAPLPAAYGEERHGMCIIKMLSPGHVSPERFGVCLWMWLWAAFSTCELYVLGGFLGGTGCRTTLG